MDRRGLLQPQGSPTESQQAQEQADRKARASKSILEFGKIYFSHYLKCAISPLHQYLVEKFYQVITSQWSGRYAIAAPRTNAKTTWLSKICVLWCLCFPEIARKKFILLLSDTTGQAKLNLAAVRREIEHNVRLREDFGDLEGDFRKDRRLWTAEDIITANKIQVSAYGTGKSLRGATMDESRPDLVIGDDIENEEQVATQFQRDKTQTWWTDTVLETEGAGSSKLDAFLAGTILHPDSVLQRLVNNRAYGSAVFRAVEQWPEREDLWQQWERIYTDPSNGDAEERKSRAWEYYQDHREEMDRGAKVLWPEGEPIYRLKEKYITSGPASFNREKQNEPRNPETCVFQEEWIKYWWLPEEEGRPQDLRLPQIRYTIGALDPSLGKHQKKGDYSAILVLGRGVDGRDYVLEADLARRPPDQIIADMIAYHKQYRCKEWAVEANQFQDFLRTTLEARALEAGVHLPTVAIHSSTDKKGRIESLQPAIRSGFVVFRAIHTLLLSQLQFYTGHSGDHDDGPDALEMAYSRDQGGPIASCTAPDVGYGRVLGRSGIAEPPTDPKDTESKNVPTPRDREPFRVASRNPFRGR